MEPEEIRYQLIRLAQLVVCRGDRHVEHSTQQEHTLKTGWHIVTEEALEILKDLNVAPHSQADHDASWEEV